MSSTNNTRQESTPSKLLPVPLLIMLSMLMMVISVLSLAVYDRLRFQPIMTVDVELIMQDKLNQLQQQTNKVNQDQLVQLSKQWAQQLATEVAWLSNEYHAVVLARPAVVHGSIDMTQHVMIKLNGGKQ